MGIIANYKALPGQTQTLLAAGTVLGLFVALPLFIFALTSPNRNFDIRNRAQEPASPGPTASASAVPSATPSGSPLSSSLPAASPNCSSADINKDGVVDLADYNLFISDFFKTHPANPRSDINGDGLVDLTDYSLLVSKFSKSTGACQ